MTNSECIGGGEKRLKFHITYVFVLSFVFKEKYSRNWNIINMMHRSIKIL